MAMGQNSTGRIDYLNQTSRDCSTNDEWEGTQRKSVIPDAEESRRCWSDIWDQAVTHRENTDWLRKAENELGELTVQDDIHIEI